VANGPNIFQMLLLSILSLYNQPDPRVGKAIYSTDVTSLFFIVDQLSLNVLNRSHQIFMVGSRMGGDGKSDIRFAIARGTLLW